MKIRTKILLLFLVSILIIGSVYFFFLVPQFIANEVSRIEKDLSKQMSLTEQMINEALQPVRQSMDSIAANIQKDNITDSEISYVAQQFASVLKKNSEMKNIFLIDNSGLVLSQGDLQLDSAVDSALHDPEIWYKKALKAPDSFVFYGPYQTAGDKTFYMTAVKAIADDTGKVKYVLGSEININQIAFFIKGPRTEINGLRGLVMESGIIEAGIDGVLSIGEVTAENKQIIDAFDSKSIIVAKIIQHADKKYFYLYARRLQGTHWILYLQIPEKDVYKLVSGRSLPVLWASGLLTVVILMSLLVVVQLYVVRPLSRLQEVTSYILYSRNFIPM